MQTLDKVFHKILEKNKCLSAADMTPEQKVRMYELFQRYSAGQYFIYDRFFQKGFQQWELIGIDAIKQQFLADHETEIGMAAEQDDTIQRLSLSAEMYNTPGSFFNLVSKVRGLRTDLYDRMNALGMKSNTTVMPRFTHDNWRPWERIGIRAIIQEFIRNEEARANA